MRLSKIKLAGFKSFVDPTTINFSSNLTAIVGPNGCGKSNTIDAVRWVMGESSAKHLRGEAMADVIFNGSSARKPVGKASVELVFDNTEGKLGGQYASFNEMAIRREVTREGASNYFINNTKCRRRDVTDIFLGTGLGPRSYAIIEQGTISRLIEAKPEELRVFLEEAAGISKYKERRRETENRIRHTRDNLDRLDDVRSELEQQLNRLQRQAKTAEKYRELKQDERAARANVLALRLRAINAEISTRANALGEAENAAEAALANQRKLETQLETQRQNQSTANDTLNTVQARYYSVGGEIARLEQHLQHHRDLKQRQTDALEHAKTQLDTLKNQQNNDQARLNQHEQTLAALEPQITAISTQEKTLSDNVQAAETALQNWQKQWEEHTQKATAPRQQAEVERTKINHLEREFQRRQQRENKLKQELNQLTNNTQNTPDIAALETALTQASTACETAEQALAKHKTTLQHTREQERNVNTQLNTTRGQLQKLNGRLASLEALQQAALHRTNNTTANWLKNQTLTNAPRLAEQLQVNPGWETAVEAVLGHYLDAVCVENLDTLNQALSTLDKAQLSLVEPLRAPAEVTTNSLLAQLNQAEKFPFAGLLAPIKTADDLSAALSARQQLAAYELIVTRNGTLVGPNWLRLPRDDNAQAGVLAREQEIRSLTKERDALQQQVQSQQTEHDQLREQAQKLEREREQQQNQLNQAHRTQNDTRSRLQSAQTRLEQTEKRQAELTQELTEVVQRISTDDDELKAARGRLETAMQQMAEFEDQRKAQLAEKNELQQQLNQARNTYREARDNLHRLTLQRETQRTAMSGIEAHLQRTITQQQELQNQYKTLSATVTDADEPIEAAQKQLKDQLEQQHVVEIELTAAREAVADVDGQLRTFSQQRQHIEQQVEQCRKAVEAHKLAQQEHQVRRQTLHEQLVEAGQAPEELLVALTDNDNITEWEARLNQLEARIQRLGAINLAAIDECRQQEERKTYLDAQHADLSEALATLENAIGKIDRETRSRFKETFEKVNAGFQTMFPRLFGGGYASLELTSDDLLATGVHVMARPPGKRNTSIHLLSGGEKALTAVALVFAIFELNPAPFCMLDEVDAPLDDANVGRFSKMVAAMSEHVQFIFITHNKITMETASQLSGVTMQEAGVSRLVAVDIDEALQMVG